MLGSFPEQQRQVIDQLMDQDDAKELAERMLAAGWTDTALIRFTVAQAIQGSAKVRRCSTCFLVFRASGS
jgi:hypothetical protein